MSGAEIGADPATEGPVVVYLAGSGRSGSTLVERTLGTIPGFVNVGELIDLFRRSAPLDERCGCRHRFSECPFWTEVGWRAFGGWDPAFVARIAGLHRELIRQRRVPGLLAYKRMPASYRRRMEEYIRAFRAIYTAAADLTGADVVVDASKWPAQALCLGTDPGLDLRILHVVRDPRGVAHSWGKAAVSRPQANGIEKLSMATRGGAAASLLWSVAQVEAELAGRRARSVAKVTYEDFTRQPRTCLVDALGRVGLVPQPDWFAHIDGQRVTMPASHGLSGNPSRFIVGDVTLVADEEWRTAMSPPARRLVTSLTFVPAAALGYGGRGRHAAPSEQPVRHPRVEDWPMVSVVLPTRGRPELLRRSLQSVLGQRYPGKLECIVVHDQELVDPSLADLAAPDRAVKVIANTHKPGLAGARNSGLAQTHGAIVASCDDDDVWLPDKLRKQVRLLIDEPDLLVVGSGIRLMMPAGRVVEWPGRSKRISYDVLLRNRVKELHSSTLTMWRDAFAKAGEYDEDLPFGYGEDYDWVLRVARVGRIGVVQEPLAEISKNVPSWFRERASNTAIALEVLLDKHPEIKTSRRGYARVLGQIAFARASLGERRVAVRGAVHALSVWPLGPHAMLALLQAALGMDPRRLLDVARRLGRGLS